MKGLSPHLTRYFDPGICEDDLHDRQQMESKMNHHDMATKTIARLFMCIKQEDVKYMDVAIAAQAVYESAAYAIEVVQTDVDLAKSNYRNTNLNK